MSCAMRGAAAVLGMHCCMQASPCGGWQPARLFLSFAQAFHPRLRFTSSCYGASCAAVKLCCAGLGVNLQSASGNDQLDSPAA